jgi:mono/diheme cytochrome c family protein
LYAWQFISQELTAKPGPIIAALMATDKANSSATALSESGKQGRQIYETLCTTCHGPDGKGVKSGDKFLAPPLTNSQWFKHGGNAQMLARIVLKGQVGPVDGRNYGEGLMLPLEQTYNDEQLASVLNFIGQRGHGWKKPVASAEITTVRKEIADRKTPWTQEELKALSKQKK